FIQLHAGGEMRSYGYATQPSGLSKADWVRFGAVVWPDRFARMVAWRTIEGLQQRFPRWVPRRPASKMIIDPPREGPS
ncbi:MAG TPA: hypothetical protein VNP90_05310, partial [Actinomycetota bacterium]|nr:hypothetical protein [Actinomycetota bacterium]